MKLLDVVHPAAKTLVDIAKSQDAEVRNFYYLFPVKLLFNFGLIAKCNIYVSILYIFINQVHYFARTV